jgi:predicted dehydrogenase
VALADVTREHLDRTREVFHVARRRSYYRPDAYNELAYSNLQAVVIETPPYYHPVRAQSAIDAGKHVYLAKPVAVDVAGCRSIVATERRPSRRILPFWWISRTVRSLRFRIWYRAFAGAIWAPRAGTGLPLCRASGER